MQKISAIIIAFNEGHSLGRTLDSVKWCDEIVVIDSGSTDRTRDIAVQCGCKVVEHPFDGYGAQKRFAVAQAGHDWVLNIDADEVVTPSLAAEIRTVLSTEAPAAEGFFIPRSLFFLGKRLCHGADHREFCLRLFDRRKGNFNEKTIHESVVVHGRTSRLRETLLHYSYDSLEDYFTKFNRYTTQAALALKRNKVRVSGISIVAHFILTFAKSYLVRGNILNGYRGFIWSALAGLYPMVKYAKLADLSGQERGQP